MGRSGYSDDLENWELIMWRGRVMSAIRGKRGQRLLLDLVKALDAMPDKRLIKGSLEDHGEVCALGAVGQRRGIDMKNLDPDDYDGVSAIFDIASCLAREVAFMNDDAFPVQTPEERWTNIRAWALQNILPIEEEEYGRTTE